MRFDISLCTIFERLIKILFIKKFTFEGDNKAQQSY